MSCFLVMVEVLVFFVVDCWVMCWTFSFGCGSRIQCLPFVACLGVGLGFLQCDPSQFGSCSSVGLGVGAFLFLLGAWGGDSVGFVGCVVLVEVLLLLFSG